MSSADRVDETDLSEGADGLDLGEGLLESDPAAAARVGGVGLVDVGVLDHLADLSLLGLLLLLELLLGLAGERDLLEDEADGDAECADADAHEPLVEVEGASRGKVAAELDDEELHDGGEDDDGNEGGVAEEALEDVELVGEGA